jgi:hypothetical protein
MTQFLNTISLNKIRLKTMKEKMRIYDELYGKSGGLPQLTQVVPGKYYHRGDHSYIKCQCGKRLNPEERDNRFGRCNVCADRISKIPYPIPDYEKLEKRKYQLAGLARSSRNETY